MPERIPVRAVRNGGTDYIEVPTQEEAWIAALRRERDGYVMHGNTQGVADVDAELRRLGADPGESTRGNSENRPDQRRNNPRTDRRY